MKKLIVDRSLTRANNVARVLFMHISYAYITEHIQERSLIHASSVASVLPKSHI